jgi:hypothetical protein
LSNVDDLEHVLLDYLSSGSKNSGGLHRRLKTYTSEWWKFATHPHLAG